MNQPKDLKLQFIRFDRGIGQYNHDYYAALGLPLICNPLYIRNVYLRIARVLHPDVYGFSAGEKEIATQYLAKLVNPAYNSLMKENDRKAYQEIFKLLAKRLMQRSRHIQIHSEIACELVMTPSDAVYERLVTEIAKVQYESLTHILDYTAQISELNLVYILYKEGYQHGASNMPPVLAPMLTPTSTRASTQNFLPPPSKPSYAYNLNYIPTPSANNPEVNAEETVIQTSSEGGDLRQMIDNRMKTCEIYILQNNWNAALRDLREILQIDQDNSLCLALLGVVYQNINQPQMAKASFKRSLQINPQEALALKHLLDFDDPTLNSGNNPKRSTTIIKKKTPTVPVNHSWMSKLREWISRRG